MEINHDFEVRIKIMYKEKLQKITFVQNLSKICPKIRIRRGKIFLDNRQNMS